MLDAVRDLALFLAIDSKLPAFDLVATSVADVAISGRVRDRAIIIQGKTGRTRAKTREAVAAWIGNRRLGERDYLLPSHVHALPHLSTRQYSRVPVACSAVLERMVWNTELTSTTWATICCNDSASGLTEATPSST